MDNPEKLATYGTQGEEKQSKTTTQYVLDTTIHKTYVMTKKYKTKTQQNMYWTPLYKKNNTNNVNKTGALLQPTGGKNEPNIFWGGFLLRKS
jgi:hypothetical protein